MNQIGGKSYLLFRLYKKYLIEQGVDESCILEIPLDDEYEDYRDLSLIHIQMCIRDSIEGKPKLTEADVDKPVSIAANEIAEDLITYRREEE